jgi:hypothetical protein
MKEHAQTLNRIAEPFRIPFGSSRKGGDSVRKGSEFQGGKFPILNIPERDSGLLGADEESVT